MTQNVEWKLPKNITKIVVDGANVAFATKIGKKADINNLKLLLTQLCLIKETRPDLTFEIICDASLKHRISNPNCYEKLLQGGIIRQCPPYVVADKFIISLLQQFDGEILLISNDLFRDHVEVSTLAQRTQFGFIYAFGQLCIEEIIFFKPSEGFPIQNSSQTIEENLVV